MIAIYKRELRAYFNSMIGWVFIAALMVVVGIYFMAYNMYQGYIYFSYALNSACNMLMLMVPVLTMRSMSEERASRTDQLLLTAPVTLTGMVLGKFFAAFTLFVSTVIISTINFFPLYAIATVERNGSYSTTHVGPATAEIVGRTIGLILIGAAFIAIGLFISALSENQLSAAVITIAVLLCTVVLSMANQYINVYAIRFVLDWICILGRYANFSYGMFDWSALLYYISITSVFLFLTIRVYDRRRWN